MSETSAADLAKNVEGRMPFAADLFEAIRAETADFEGVTRPAGRAADQAAAARLAAAAREIGLETRFDAAGNLLCTLPGRDRQIPGILTGSHLDSVPVGGNYDGLAGAMAGLVALAAIRDAGQVPACDLTMIGTRAEESVWFGVAYLGSRLAVGALPADELDRLVRSDTGRTLAAHMDELGFDVAALKSTAAPAITPANTRAFLELHIEQGPILVGEAVPVAVPTVIRGNLRYPYARCRGRYDHSAATPRAYREDALLATVELVQALETYWIEQDAASVPDTVFTVGKLFTEADQHAMTKVAGRTDFTLNFGGTTKAFLEDCRIRTETLAREIGAARRVSFELGENVGSDPTPLDPALRGLLEKSADELDIPRATFATVGHDASIFARAGIPSAMVLVRNEAGSHNPAETMDLADFAAGTKVLATTMATLAEGSGLQ